jgi:hypothetical protein
MPGSEPDSGKPTVRDLRGVCKKWAMVELKTLRTDRKGVSR